MTPHPDEGTLHAFIDGELSAGEATALEAHVAECELCGAALAEARGFAAGASRAISALDAAPSSASRPVVARPDAVPSTRPKSKPFVFRVPFARAAALLLLAGGTAVVINQSGTDATEVGLRMESVAADAAMPMESAADVAPTTAAAPAPVASPMAAPASADLSASRVATGTGAVAGKAAAPGRASAVSVDDAAAGVVPEPRPVGASAQTGNVASVQAAPTTATVAPSRPSIAAPTAPPTALPPARLDLGRDAVASSEAAAPATRVSRFRTKEGVVLTLTDEPLRTSFAEERSVARQRAMPSAATMSAAPAVNTYRWSNEEQGRTYTLTGPLTVAELEAAARRLTELERVN